MEKIDYRKASNELRLAWFEYKKQMGEKESLRLIDFAAGWNAAKGNVIPIEVEEETRDDSYYQFPNPGWYGFYGASYD